MAERMETDIMGQALRHQGLRARVGAMRRRTDQAACNKGTRPPLASSAIRSSQPPTWVSPMKI